MSILFIESFDHYNTTSDWLLKKWTSQTGTSFQAQGRRSTQSLQVATSALVSKNWPGGATAGPAIVGVAAKLDGLPGTNGQLINFRDATSFQCEIRVDNLGAVYATRNGTQLGSKSANGVIAAGSYQYVEAKVTINNSTGSVIVRVNGVEVLNLTNQDTQNTANATFDNVQFQGPVSNTQIDDIYFADTAGGTDFLGDVRVDYAAVNAAGNYTQWTPSAGSNFQNVDDSPDPDDDTTYNETDVDSEKDSYQHAAFASLVVEDIKALQVFVAAKKSDAGTRTLRVGVRSGATDNLDSAAALSTDYTMRLRIFETDPNTAAAWTKSAIDAVESLVECGAP